MVGVKPCDPHGQEGKNKSNFNSLKKEKLKKTKKMPTVIKYSACPYVL